MAPTENHEYSQPSKGTQDWDQPLNQNFAEIDTDVEVRDTGGPTAGQNSYTPADGAKYLDTDSGVVYTGDGSAWTATHALARFTPQSGGTGSIVLGATSNTVGTNASNIVTGGRNNDADGPYAAVGGGQANTASDQQATVPGGFNNTASALGATVGGGLDNEASEPFATVAGGDDNEATSGGATVAGGQGNEASATDATVLGGGGNTASGEYSTAMGRNATADNDGAFVVGDATSTSVSSSFDNVALFQQNIVSEASITTGSSYEYDESSMSTSTFVNGADNDVWEVTSPGIYGTPISRLSVEETGDVGISGDLDVNGDITGNSKNFAQTVDTDDGRKEVVYTATEAGEARTEVSGVAELDGGRAEIDLPEHFAWVTSDDEPLVVQVTAHASERVGPQVTARSPERIVVEDFAGVETYEISYTVRGTREGHEDREVVRDPARAGKHPVPADD